MMPSSSPTRCAGRSTRLSPVLTRPARPAASILARLLMPGTGGHIVPRSSAETRHLGAVHAPTTRTGTPRSSSGSSCDLDTRGGTGIRPLAILMALSTEGLDSSQVLSRRTRTSAVPDRSCRAFDERRMRAVLQTGARLDEPCLARGIALRGPVPTTSALPHVRAFARFRAARRDPRRRVGVRRTPALLARR